MTDNYQHKHVKDWLKDGKQVQVNVFGKWRTVSPSFVQQQIDKGRQPSQFRLACCNACYYCKGEKQV